MATWEFKNIDEYIEQIHKIYTDVDRYVLAAINEGGHVMGEAIKDGIKSLPVDDDPQRKDMRNGINSLQREGLLRSFGFAPLRTDGTLKNRKLGFDGYNAIKTDRWPNGQPNAMIARSVESGTSFMRKNPFINKALRSKKTATEQAMQERLDREIGKLVK